MASTTRGSAFYEYHKTFLARASALLLQRNINIDWSVRDTKLFTTIFSRQTTIRWKLFCSLAYLFYVKDGSTPFVGHANYGKTKQTPCIMNVRERPRILCKGKYVINFNGTNWCHGIFLQFLSHLFYSECKLNNHSQSICSKEKQNKTRDHP